MPLHRNCEGFTRRECLQLGLGGLLAGGLVEALRATALGGASSEIVRQADSCILIWMDGGPSHYETFDPKPEAPVEIRGQFGTIPTKLPGVHFSEPMKRLASLADRFAVIRSIRHDQGNHGALRLTGHFVAQNQEVASRAEGEVQQLAGQRSPAIVEHGDLAAAGVVKPAR